MADHEGSGSGGNVLEQPEDRGESSTAQIEDQTTAEGATDTSATVESGGDGVRSLEQTAGDEVNRRATEAEPRAMVQDIVADPRTDPIEPSQMEEDPTAVGSSSGKTGESEQGGGDDTNPRAIEEEPRATVLGSPVGPAVAAEGPQPVEEGAVASGSGGGDGPIEREEPSALPPRDPVRGKGIVGAEETTEVPVAIREADILFRPAATSSSHIPITTHDVAEHLPDEMLAKLLEDNPLIGEIVLKAKEDRARAIEASEAAERAERELRDREELLRDMEAEERARAEAVWPRVTAVAEAGRASRPVYSAEDYVPPTPHLFVPSGYTAYVPQRSEYDDELVLRDPSAHISMTWAEVYPERPPFCTSIRYLYVDFKISILA
jgi:hypothetical protein